MGLGSLDPDLLDPWEPIDLSFESGAEITVPFAFARWMRERDLVDDYAELLAQWQRDELNGDILRHFAVGHNAPRHVVDSITPFELNMRLLYGGDDEDAAQMPLLRSGGGTRREAEASHPSRWT